MTIWNILETAWAGLLLVGLPLSSRALGRRLDEEAPARMDLYLSAALSQLFLLAPTLFLDLAGNRAGVRFLHAPISLPRLFAWTLATLAACVALWLAMVFEAKRRPERSDAVVLNMLPRTRREMAAFSAISLLAGFSEEYLLRGFALAVVALLTGSMLLSAAVTTLSFGLAHLYQGPRGALRATVLGVVLVIPVVVTGSLVPSIIAHSAIDLISGRWTLSLLRRGSASTG